MRPFLVVLALSLSPSFALGSSTPTQAVEMFLKEDVIPFALIPLFALAPQQLMHSLEIQRSQLVEWMGTSQPFAEAVRNELFTGIREDLQSVIIRTYLDPFRIIPR